MFKEELKKLLVNTKIITENKNCMYSGEIIT